MLQNCNYRGEIVHKERSYRGEHTPIIDREPPTAAGPVQVFGVERSLSGLSAGKGEGFEPSVPLVTASLILAEDKGLQADPARAGTAA